MTGLEPIYKRIAETQAAGNVCAFVDGSCALNIEAARTAGVRVEEMLISQPDTSEQAADIVETLVRSEAVALIVRTRGRVWSRQMQTYQHRADVVECVTL